MALFPTRMIQPPHLRLTGMAQTLADLRRDAARADAETLDAMRDATALLRDNLDRLEGDLRVALTGCAPAVPQGLDLSLRPPFWQHETRPGAWTRAASGTYLADGMTLFHDCPLAEIGLRQKAQTRAAPFGMDLDVFGFQGSYLSIALDLPDHCAAGLSTDHILQVDARLRRDPARPVLVRLNIQAGPNTAQMLRTMAENGDSGVVEFDLAYSELGDTPAEKLWLDILFDDPAMSRVEIADMRVSRRRRAEI